MGLVYQRATAKLALITFLILLINGLWTINAIDRQTETKVLLRRLKRHLGVRVALLSLCHERVPRKDRSLAIFAPVVAA